MANNNSIFTSKSIESPKLPLIISIIVAIVVDIVATFMLYKFNYDIQFVLIPTAMVILDLVFLGLSLTSNYRYKYTILQFIAYVVLILLAVAGISVLGGLFQSQIVMTTLAMIIWGASHLLVCVATIITSLNAAKVMKSSSAPASIVIVFLLTVGGAACVLNLLDNGFFGQGIIEENKTIIYEYKSDEDCYIAKGTLNGRGNTVVIPNSFNGKDVLYFDGQLLKDEALKVVRFEERVKDISFINLDLLDKDYTSDLSIYAHKDDLKQIRDEILSHKNSNDVLTGNILNLINNFYPESLEANEVYISFNYSKESFEIVSGEVFDVWFGKKGDTFSLSDECFERFNYTKYYDKNNLSHLDWNYVNNGKYILNTLVNKEGSSIYDVVIQDNVKNVEVSFDKIFAIYVNEDNDSLYDVSSEHEVDEIDNKLTSNVVDYRYALVSTVDEIISNYPTRQGFELNWYLDSGYSKEFTSLVSVLNESSTNEINIYPKWTLNAPQITSITTNDSDNSFIYGDNVNVNANVNAIADGIIFEYKWESKDGIIKDGNNSTFENVHPNQSGTYKLEVTAKSDTFTSLTSTSSKTFDVLVEKKALNFNWETEIDMVYDGTNKIIECTPLSTDIINNDQITISYSNDIENLKNAGNYSTRISLTGDCDEKYYIASGATFSFEIKQKEIDVIWSDERTFTYDGTKKTVAIESADGLVSGDSIDYDDYIFVGENINVGNYNLEVNLKTGLNYKISTSSSKVSYEITKRNVTVTFEDYEKIYDGSYVSSVSYEPSNVAATDDFANIFSFTYEFLESGVSRGSSVKDAGNYTCIITTKNGSLAGNYNLIMSNENPRITIEKRVIELVWQSQNELIYNGQSQGILVTSVNGAVTSDRNTIINKLTYNGHEVNASSSSYIMQAKLSSDIFKNYCFSDNGDISECDFYITPKELKVELSGYQKEYDGENFNSYDPIVTGLVTSDTFENVCSYTKGIEEGNGIDAGKYTIYINVSLNSSNYKLTTSAKQVAELTITKRNITLVWDDERTFTYDGQLHDIDVIDIENVVSKDKDQIPSNLEITGDSKDAGGHVMNCVLKAGSTYANNYTITNPNCDYVIKKANLVVTASSVTKDYTGAVAIVNGDVTYDHSGLVSTDVISEVGILDYEGTARNAKDVNSEGYVITPKFISRGAKYDNYNITYVSGKLTIKAVDLIVKINISKASFTYNGKADYELTVTYEGFKGADNETSVIKKVTYYVDGNVMSEKPVEVGTYQISVKVELYNSNYNVKYEPSSVNLEIIEEVNEDDEIKENN